MFKKLVIASAVLAATSSVAFAHGTYKGDYKSAEMPCAAYTPAIAPYVGISVGVRNNYANGARDFIGMPLALSLGYGGLFPSNFYLAGEIFADDSIGLRNYASGVYSLKTTWDYGASIIPGYMMTDHVLAFLRLGAVETRFVDQSKTRAGWQLGLGGQVSLNQNWDMRVEYTYTNYSSLSGIGHPQSQQTKLGLIYRFV